MIHTDEDDEFERIAHEAKLKGQPYYFQDHTTDPDKLVYRKPSRNFDDDDIQEYVRPWVGLTKEERDGKRVLENGLLFNSAEAQVWEMAVEWAEAKLKEKNT